MWIGSKASTNLDFDANLAGNEQVKLLHADESVFVEDLVLVLTSAWDMERLQVADHSVLKDVFRVGATGAIVDVVIDADDGAGGLLVE